MDRSLTLRRGRTFGFLTETIGLVAILLVLACLALILQPLPAAAQQQGLNNGRAPSMRPFGTPVNSVSTYTNGTTSYTAVSGAAVTDSTFKDPATAVSYGGPYVFEHLYVTWSADATKSTAGTGTCALALNGNVIASTARTLGGTNEGNLAGTADLYYANGFSTSSYSANWNTGTQGETQAVALYCKSSDTNTFTVNNASLTVTEGW